MKFFSADISNVIQKDLKSALLSIARMGAVGNVKDFQSWINMYITLAKKLNQKIPEIFETISIDSVKSEIEKLEKASLFKDSGKGYDEFLAPEQEKFQRGQKISYNLLGDISYSPLQLVRSRLERFLVSFGITIDDLTDLSIGVIEAAENAVKYGGGGVFSVSYELAEDNEFSIIIINSMPPDTIYEKIRAGKYTEKFTLMRGIMAMDKLFDKFDIDRLEDKGEVHFQAFKKVRVA